MTRHHYSWLMTIKAYYDTTQYNYVALHLYVNAWPKNERHFIPTANVTFNGSTKRRIRVASTTVLHSEGLGSNTETGYLTEGFLILQENFGIVPTARPRPIHFTFFHIHYSLITPRLEGIQPELLIASLNKK
jgi:hypothetical protein